MSARVRFLLATASVLFCAQAWSGNGLQVTGFGAQSSLMGGADVAYPLDATTLNANPAGLSRFTSPTVDTYMSSFYIENRHQDSLGNDRISEADSGAVFGFSYARPSWRSDVVWGLGLFVQGGVGFNYEDLDTGAGSPDELTATFSLVKLAPAIAWQISPQWSVGINLGINYAAIDAAVLPDTSRYDVSVTNPGTLPILLQNPSALTLGSAQAPFFGIRLKNIAGTSINIIAGTQWRPDDHWHLGLAYASATDLSLENGSFTLDMSSVGLGKVKYSDAALEQLSMPQSVSLGAAYDAGRWLLAMEYTWIDYSSAFSAPVLVGTRDSGGSQESVRLPFSLEFSDQHVYAIGLQYRLSAKTRAIVGANYAKQPIPGKNLFPLISVISEKHVAFGISHDLSPHYRVDVGFEFQLPNKVDYENSQFPMGSGARESSRAILLHFMVGRQW